MNIIDVAVTGEDGLLQRRPCFTFICAMAQLHPPVLEQFLLAASNRYKHTGTLSRCDGALLANVHPPPFSTHTPSHPLLFCCCVLFFCSVSFHHCLTRVAPSPGSSNCELQSRMLDPSIKSRTRLCKIVCRRGALGSCSPPSASVPACNAIE
jgi:hypothetical protein